jgi:hypothetical protein
VMTDFWVLTMKVVAALLSHSTESRTVEISSILV